MSDIDNNNNVGLEKDEADKLDTQINDDKMNIKVSFIFIIQIFFNIIN